MQIISYTTYETLIGAVLRKMRKDHKQKQSAIADSLKLNVSTYSKIENGISGLAATQLKTICDHYEIKVSDFYKRVEELEIKTEQAGVRIVNEGTVYLDTDAISKSFL